MSVEVNLVKRKIFLWLKGKIVLTVELVDPALLRSGRLVSARFMGGRHRDAGSLTRHCRRCDRGVP